MTKQKAQKKKKLNESISVGDERAGPLMMEKDNDNKNPPVEKKRISWKRRLWRWTCRLLLLLVVGGVVGFFAVKYLIAPQIVGGMLDDFIGHYWNGKTRVGWVEFSLDPDEAMVARNVRIQDSLGRNWVTIDRMVFAADDWPSFSPVLHTIDIQSPKVTCYSDKGKLYLPLKPFLGAMGTESPEDENDKAAEPKSDYAPPAMKETLADPTPPPAVSKTDDDDDDYDLLQIRKVLIRDATVELVMTDRDESPADPPFEVLRHVRIFGEIQFEGNIRMDFAPDIETRLSGKGSLKFTRLEVTDLRALMHARPLEGEVQPRPLVLSSVDIPEVILDNEFLRFPKMTARIGTGYVWMKGVWMDLMPNRPVRFGFDFGVQNMPMKKFYNAYDPSQDVEYGFASAVGDNVRFSQAGMETLDMETMILLNNSDLDQAHVFKQTYKKLKVDDDKIKEGSDVQVLLLVKKGVMRIYDGKVGNNLAAILIEQGGVVNLPKREMDIHVTAGLLTDLNRVAVIGWFSKSGQALTRLRITGDWRDPVLKVEPFGNVAKGTTAFFGGMLKSFGQLHHPPVPATPPDGEVTLPKTGSK